MDDDMLEQMALSSSTQHFRDDSGEDTADNMLLFADILLYMAAGSCIILALSQIWGDSLDPRTWSWSQIDVLMLLAGIGLWLCSQAINNFRRILPTWLRILLKLPMAPKSISEQSSESVKRRGRILLLAAGLAVVGGWRVNIGASELAGRIGVPFWTVLAGLAILLALTGLRWIQMADQDSTVKVFR